HKATLRRADREEQVDHPEDHSVLAQNKNAPSVWLLQNEPQSPHLLRAIRHEISFVREEIVQQIDHLWKVFKSCLLDHQIFIHAVARSMAERKKRGKGGNPPIPLPIPIPQSFLRAWHPKRPLLGIGPYLRVMAGPACRKVSDRERFAPISFPR